MNLLVKIINIIGRGLNWVALIALLAMMLLAVANIISRVPAQPIYGTFEIIEYLGAAVVAFALAETQLRKGNISVSIITDRLKPRVQTVLSMLGYFLATIVFALGAWQTAVYANGLWIENRQSDSLGIIYGPIIYIATIGLAFMALILLLDFVKAIIIVKDKNKQENMVSGV